MMLALAGMHLFVATSVPGECPVYTAGFQPRRAVVHIGPPKTGTSHTQAWIVENAARLMEHGWAWPRSENGHFVEAKGLLALADTLCGRVSVWNSRDPDSRDPSTVLNKYSTLLRRAGTEGRNILISNEVLGVTRVLSAEGKKTLRRILAHAGIENATVVAMLRTPLVEWYRSNYNQHYDGPRMPFHLKQAQPFSSTAKKYMFDQVNEHIDLRGWEAAGFDVQMVSLEGVERAGLDETDVLACEVLGIDCGSDGKWPYGRPHTGENQRPGHPVMMGSLAAAWNIYAEQHRNCSRASERHHAKTLVQLSAKITSAMPMPNASNIMYDCTDYTDMEASARQALEAKLDKEGVCVRHRVPPPVEPPSLRYCELNPARLANTHEVKMQFDEICANISSVVLPKGATQEVMRGPDGY